MLLIRPLDRFSIVFALSVFWLLSLNLHAFEVRRVPQSVIGDQARKTLATYDFRTGLVGESLVSGTLSMRNVVGRSLEGWPKRVYTERWVGKACDRDLLRSDGGILVWFVDGLCWGESYWFQVEYANGKSDTAMVTPFPYWASDSRGHRVEMSLVSLVPWTYMVMLTGFEIGEVLTITSVSGDETISSESVYTGQDMITWMPGVLGVSRGVATYTVSGQSTMLGLSVRWGQNHFVDERGAARYLDSLSSGEGIKL